MIVKSGRSGLNSDSNTCLLYDLGQVSVITYHKTLGPMCGTELANTISNLFQIFKLPSTP